MTEPPKANRDSWQVRPMPALKSRLPFAREFNDEEYAQASVGVIPRKMEDKWLIFLEDDWLLFYRSWTGICIYQIRISRSGDGYSIAEAWVNNDRNEYRARDGGYEAELLAFLIENLLLGKKSAFPLPADLRPDAPAGLYQHHVSGSGYPERVVPERAEEN